ncbi:Tex family protein [Thermoanaerobacter sp. CM-CNRG TB177]|uniref:RNA binding S1 domain protein n=2 Tax=Thermoanaerobacter TaxID=1754 RepID=B0KBU5_THEP3|nr:MULTISPECIES: Tex family protein [Thermoanaerobacter]ABY95390.1 RNA binding S1 domain protein [Thermoanaerobacter pseudethanolicus ATCC 33223]ADV80333.1 Tex-like protein [Thermoanaerobacter brockii subsp. finnii Ako-1]MBT1278267.1 RNA-binding transcriptional accessory protein [Thermoanaerobacter sp. CM-CNRG TB177]HBW59169.1 RNA-binding transcriptional accessory protein [Thermoanaerobacter sp.]
MNRIKDILKKEFGLKDFQVENTIKLIDEGNTIPFIARYRKEATGSLSDEVLRNFYDRLTYLRNLEEKKQDTIRLIDEQGKLTEEIKAKIENATTLQEVEDIYRPFRPKRRTRATIAKEKGLEPLAKVISSNEVIDGDVKEYAKPYLNENVPTVEEAYQGAMDIIAEDISDDADIRKYIRSFTWNNGIIVTQALKQERSPYEMYYDYKEAVKTIPPHRILAINRAEREKYISVKIEIDSERIINRLIESKVNKASIFAEYYKKAIEDSYKRLIAPSIEREIRNTLTEKAEEKAIIVFKENLKSLLLQPPIKGHVVMGFDPAYRTGCKIAVVDETGKLLDTATVYPTPPQNDFENSKKVLKELIEKYNVTLIALGNGTASRESEMFIAELIKELSREVKYVIVNEAGASVYSASQIGTEEFPDINVSLRGAISLARRLQDPLAELVKIDPKSIGVGQYQHDVDQKKLGDALNGVVEDCVNSVGVDLNTASVSLLKYVSGINAAIAKNIVEYRNQIGKFTNREQLKNVKRLGDTTFTQCAGFLRILDGDNIFDSTAVHPERYETLEKLLRKFRYEKEKLDRKKLKDFANSLEEYGLEKISEEYDIGLPTLYDIVSELKKPGRDPREDLPKPILRSDVMTINELKPGMELMGTVRNVTDFGCFVDIGVHTDGLVHISEMSQNYIKHPLDVVSVGDIVKVRVLSVDIERNRISLSMK